MKFTGIGFIKKLLNRIGAAPFSIVEFRTKLMQEEAKVGGQLFGRLPQDVRRDFFQLDADTWIWNEQVEVDGSQRLITTRYTLGDEFITKSQDGKPTVIVKGIELKNLHRAIEMYQQEVGKLYSRLVS